MDGLDLNEVIIERQRLKKQKLETFIKSQLGKRFKKAILDGQKNEKVETLSYIIVLIINSAGFSS